MSKESAEVIKEAVAAQNEGDLERYLEDIEVYRLTQGKIRRVRVFFDRGEALETVGLSE